MPMIEDTLQAHPAVAVCAAVGQPDAYAGELPVAFAVLKAGLQASVEELLAFVAPRVSEPAARPKRITLLPDLPLTSIGKIYKPGLRVLAVRHGIEEALSRAVAADAYELDVSEASVVIEVADAAAEAAVRTALMGMPIRTEVRTRASAA